MRTNKNSWMTPQLATLLISLACTSPVISAEEPYQTPPLELSAADFLSASMLSGDGYKVNERVTNDGGQNTYTMETDYGVRTAVGKAQLRAQIQEIRATRALQELEDSEEFKEAAKGAVTGMVEGGKALITSPVDTTKSAAKGVGRWFGNVGRSITSDDPHQGNAFKTAVGYESAKRAYAIQMGVDPYTDFEPFQERLGEVARAATAGGMVTSMAIKVGTAGSVAGTVASVSSLASMKKVLKANPPATLTTLNQDKLEAMGIASHQAEALLRNYNYTPMEITLLVEALNRMGDIGGREILVTFATGAPDGEVARFMQLTAEMLADYITNKESGNLVSIAGHTWLLTQSGNLVGTFPLDYVAWTANASKATDVEATKAAHPGIKRMELRLTGEFSPQARAALEPRGWKLTENVRVGEPDKSS